MERLKPGYTLADRYVLRKKVGAGGMGEVWAANDTLLARTVALKIMHPRTEDEVIYAQRFREEAMHTAGLSHLNIATLFDYGEDDGLAFLVMELVRGVTLQQLLDTEGAQAPSRVRSVMGQAALALSVAHEAGIVHRDVKPANIMVSKDGTVKLTDFGIARSDDSAGLTRHGEMLGTPHYVSPEQALGHVATPASDLYALGIVAHELLSGRRPFDKGTPIATALAQVQELPPPLPDGVPDDLREVIERCLEKDPADRPASALEVAGALGTLVEATWRDELDVTPRRAVVEDDDSDGPRSVSLTLGATEPLSLPAGWDDPDPTPPLSVDPSTGEIEQGAFPAAGAVRARVAEEGFTAEPDPVDVPDPGDVAEDPLVSISADPWPEAHTPPPLVAFDDVPPIPQGRATQPAAVGDVVAVTGSQPVARRGVPIGWVLVIVLIAVALALVIDRIL